MIRVYLIENWLGPNRHDLALVQLNSWRHFLQGGVQAFVLLALLKCLFVYLALFAFVFHFVSHCCHRQSYHDRLCCRSGFHQELLHCTAEITQQSLHNMEPDGGSRGAATIADSQSGVQHYYYYYYYTTTTLLRSTTTTTTTITTNAAQLPIGSQQSWRRRACRHLVPCCANPVVYLCGAMQQLLMESWSST